MEIQKLELGEMGNVGTCSSLYFVYVLSSFSISYLPTIFHIYLVSSLCFFFHIDLMMHCIYLLFTLICLVVSQTQYFHIFSKLQVLVVHISNVSCENNYFIYMTEAMSITFIPLTRCYEILGHICQCCYCCDKDKAAFTINQSLCILNFLVKLIELLKKRRSVHIGYLFFCNFNPSFE